MEAVTEKYNRKQSAILDAAVPVFTERGLGNTRLSDVAAAVGLKTTSITYYFKRKEDLAAACYLHTIAEFVSLCEAALQGADSCHDSVHCLLREYFALRTAIECGDRPALMLFDEVLSLRGSQADEVFAAYADMFRALRKVVAAAGVQSFSRAESTARAHLLLSQLLWIPAWIGRYRPVDYPRLADHMYDIFAHGIMPAGASWNEPETPRFPAPSDARDVYLKAAIETINSTGYSGASVDKIAERLNLTKGSFYHHYDSKDELGLACFRRSFSVVEQALQATAPIEDSADRLVQALCNLVHFQLDDAGPLLTAGAIRTLSPELRKQVLDGYQRLSSQLADIVIDGIIRGELRPVDPLIASQMLTEAITAAHQLPRWLKGVSRDTALQWYAKPVVIGALRGDSS